MVEMPDWVMLAQASIHGCAKQLAERLARPWMLACASMTLCVEQFAERLARPWMLACAGMTLCVKQFAERLARPWMLACASMTSCDFYRRSILYTLAGGALTNTVAVRLARNPSSARTLSATGQR